MKFYVSAALAGVFLVLTISAQAHHSFTSFWFTDRQVEITGVVKSIKLVNPHPEMTIEVTEANGQKSLWTITARGTGSGMLRAGWTKETLPLGMTVKVEGHPSRREGSKALAAGKITKPDGSEVWFGGGGGIPQG